MKTVMTVLGEIAPDELEIVMPHEHIVCDIARHSGKATNRLNDIELCKRELGYFKRAGGRTMVDVTTSDIGRDAGALKQIARATGVNVVMGTGYYTEKTAGPALAGRSIEELAAGMIQEIRRGIDDTGVKPGIIGELGSDLDGFSDAEQRVLRAAAATCHETALAISLHSPIRSQARRRLAILRAEAVPSDRVIMGHVHYQWDQKIDTDLAYYQELLDAGCYVEFDQIGWGDEAISEAEVVVRIQKLIEKGYGDRLLISSDLCRRSFYHENGGRGYDYIITHFTAQLEESGISKEDVKSILIDNPAAVLAS